jgi:lipid-A-disaccharide synthase
VRTLDTNVIVRLLGERLVPELLQEGLTAEAIVAEALPLLTSSESSARIQEGYGRLRQALGETGVTQRAAAAILDTLP